jgi:hypothetical protein
MGNRHCNQEKTIKKIPKSRKLALKKNIKIDYQLPSRRDIVVSWATDTFVWLMIANTALYFLDTNYYSDEVYIIILVTALLLKDNNLITTSIGKKLRKTSIIHIKTNKKTSPFFYPLRHIFSVILLLLLMYNGISIFKSLISVLSCVCLLDLLISFDKKRRMIDYVLGIAMTKDK